MKQNPIPITLTRLGVFVLLLLLMTQEAFAMHIMEGFLPPVHCLGWGIVCLPFLVPGIWKINKIVVQTPQMVTILAMTGAFTFLLSSLKIPSVTGSCSHMTGLGFAAILFGPSTACVLALIVLRFQSLLLAHGGLTTLGANTFSMGIIGPTAAFLVFVVLNKAEGSRSIAVFFAAALGSLATYVTTSLQLALTHPGETGGVMASFLKFGVLFGLTQVPLAVIEGILTVVLVNFIWEYGKDILPSLRKEERIHE